MCIQEVPNFHGIIFLKYATCSVFKPKCYNREEPCSKKGINKKYLNSYNLKSEGNRPLRTITYRFEDNIKEISNMV
jgi:hypothetical protein